MSDRVTAGHMIENEVGLPILHIPTSIFYSLPDVTSPMNVLKIDPLAPLAGFTS